MPYVERDATGRINHVSAQPTTHALEFLDSEHLADAYERSGDTKAALGHYKRFHSLFKEAASNAAQRSASTAARAFATPARMSRLVARIAT